MLFGQAASVNIPANAYSVEIPGKVAMKPYSASSANGSVELAISIPAGYSLACNNSNFSCTASSITAASIAPGEYNVTFSITKDGAPVYVWSEMVYVYPGLKTDTWNTGASGAREISSVTIESTFYVRGDGGSWFSTNMSGAEDGNDTTGNGSLAKPYATIQKAIERIKATTTAATDSFTIYVDGTFTASGSMIVANFSAIKSGCSITLKGLDATAKATLDGNDTAQGIVANGTSTNLNLTLENLIVKKGNGAYGGGIFLGTQTANTHTISNCKITNCAAAFGAGIYHKSGNLSFTNCEISGNTASGYGNSGGGGIYSYSGTLTMDGGTISGNEAKNGGGICNEGSGTLTMRGGEISGNSATTGGGIYNWGTLTMDGGTISENTATNGHGGGIYNYSGTVTMSGGTISGNTTSGSGGGIYNKGTFTMNGGTIGYESANDVASESACSNKATSYGGGIYNNGGTVTLSGGNIFYNYASNGGGIYNLNITGSKLVMGSDCTTTIKYNCCATSGGGIYSGNTFTMQAGTISNNKAINGGGIYNDGSGTFTMSGGTISGNTATTSGGGIHNRNGKLTLESGTISGNEASNGGGIYNNDGTVEMNGGTISENSATNGGGICNYGTLNFSGAAAVNVNNDVYLGAGKFITITDDLTGTNVATITPASYTAGTKVLEAENADLLSASIGKFSLPSTATNYAIAQDDTSETTKTNAVIVDNTPRATVYLDASGGSDLNDGSEKALAVKTLTRATKLLDYTAATPKIIIVSAYTLASTETGLLDFSTKSNTVTIERYYLNSTSGNYCSGHLITISSGTVEIKKVTFDGNWKTNSGIVQLANARGSLLYVGSGTTVTLGAGCTIKNNSRTDANGGGIYNTGTLNLSGATISGNSTSYGGGIYNTGGTVTMSGGEISGNTATDGGGGICNSSSGKITMNGGTISGNSAQYGGGIYNASSGTVTMSSGTISGNTATSCGGGIFISGGGTTTVSGGTIKNNAATYDPTNGSGGQGICVWKGTLQLEGGAKIESDTVRLMGGESGTDPHLKITGNLTATGNVATIWPTEYAEGAVVLEADSADLITDNYNKFVLVDASTYAICPNSANTKQAILAKPQAGGGIVIIGDVFFTLMQDGEVVTNGGRLKENATLTFTVTAKNSAGGPWTIPANAEYEIKLVQHGEPFMTANGNSLTVPGLAFLNDVYEVHMYINMGAEIGTFDDRVKNLRITN